MPRLAQYNPARQVEDARGNPLHRAVCGRADRSDCKKPSDLATVEGVDKLYDTVKRAGVLAFSDLQAPIEYDHISQATEYHKPPGAGAVHTIALTSGRQET
jgi:hypothetical protein